MRKEVRLGKEGRRIGKGCGGWGGTPFSAEPQGHAPCHSCQKPCYQPLGELEPMDKSPGSSLSYAVFSSWAEYFSPVLFSSNQELSTTPSHLWTWGGKFQETSRFQKATMGSEQYIDASSFPSLKPQEPFFCNKLPSVSEKFVLLLD